MTMRGIDHSVASGRTNEIIESSSHVSFEKRTCNCQTPGFRGSHK